MKKITAILSLLLCLATLNLAFAGNSKPSTDEQPSTSSDYSVKRPRFQR